MQEPKKLTKGHILLVFAVAVMLLIVGVPFWAALGIMLLLVVVDFLFQQWLREKEEKKQSE